MTAHSACADAGSDEIGTNLGTTGAQAVFFCQFVFASICCVTAPPVGSVCMPSKPDKPLASKTVLKGLDFEAEALSKLYSLLAKQVEALKVRQRCHDHAVNDVSDLKESNVGSGGGSVAGDHDAAANRAHARPARALMLNL